MSNITFKTAGIGAASGLLQVICVLASFACFANVFHGFMIGRNLLDYDMIGGFALGLAFAVPAIFNPTNILSISYAALMMALGVAALCFGVLLVLPWIVFMCIAMANVSPTSHNFLSIFLWFPVYLAAPALMAYVLHNRR